MSATHRNWCAHLLSDPTPTGAPQLCYCDLRDVGLCPTVSKPVVGNDIDAEAKSLIVITGANEGGKSTILRSLGAAQSMMQAGMFVTIPARPTSASLRHGPAHPNWPRTCPVWLRYR